MKILIFSSFYGNGYGLGYSSYKEAEEFCAQGHEVTLVCIDKKAFIQHHHNLKLIHLPKKNYAFIDVVDYFFKLKKFVAKYNLNKFDVIYIQSLEFGLLDFSKINIPIIYFSRSTIRGLAWCYKKYGFKKSLYKYFIDIVLIILEKRLFRYCCHVIVKSKQMQSEVIKYYQLSKNKIDIIEGGIDNQDFNLNVSADQLNILRDKYCLNINDKVLLYAGRIVPQKGLVNLIEALPLLNKKRGFKLLVAGSNLSTGFYKYISKLIIEKGLKDRVLFVGHIDQSEMRVLIGLSNAVIAPSLYEPFGMINLQAAAMGKIVITTDIVGSNNLLDRYRKIIVVKPNSATNLAESIEKIDELQSNDDNFDFSGYSWFNVANQISNIFKKCSRPE